MFVVYPIDVYEFDRKVVSRIRGLALRIGESCRDLELKTGVTSLGVEAKLSLA